MSKLTGLTRILAPIAVIGGLTGSVESNYAADYVQRQDFGIFKAGHTTTYTHTEPGVVLIPQRFTYRDICGRCYEGVNWVQQPTEIITSQCRETHIDWDKSIIAAPGNLLTAIGKALTPKPRVCDGFVPIYIAPPRVQYVPVPRCYDRNPTFGPDSRLEPIPAR